MRGKALFLMSFVMVLSSPLCKAAVDTVQVVDFRFLPSSLNIAVGDTVVWIVKQECCVPHTVTRSSSPSWNSGSLGLGASFQRIFPVCGTYSYVCSPHQGLGMVGTIQVVQAGAATKGDMNASGDLSASDVVLMLTCVFTSPGSCDACVTDVNCDGTFTAADVVLELNKVFSGVPFPC